jgi:hypothetical protein
MTMLRGVSSAPTPRRWRRAAGVPVATRQLPPRSVTRLAVEGERCTDTDRVRFRRIEEVPDRLFEGEEPVLHLIERIVGPPGLRSTRLILDDLTMEDRSPNALKSLRRSADSTCEKEPMA